MQGRCLLTDNKGDHHPRKYTPQAPDESADAGGKHFATAALESRHTHFVLVDNPDPKQGSSGWGDEIPMRDAVMRLLESWWSVPGVLPVLQGGKNTLQVVMEAIITSAT